jgi:hypothetical protein
MKSIYTNRSLLGFVGLLLFFLIIPFKLEAKAFGSDCTTRTTGGGSSCYVTTTVCKRYFLWINYDTEITDLQIDCSHLQ